MMNRLFLLFLLIASACTHAPTQDASVATRAANVTDSSALAPMKTFAAPRPAPTYKSNSDLARDFLELAFSLESGRQLPALTRVEGPVTVRVNGYMPAVMSSDLNRLLQRLRNEARINITYTTASTAKITINAVSRAEIRRYLPQAACFVVPNVSTLAEYAKARRTPRTAWSNLQQRDQIAIFVPNDTTPQEMRDCLHEELAQALGPLNDLYRLPESVFNDDNIHTILTGFDMLMLRIYYDPALRSGMSKQQVRAALPGILARINPNGANRPSQTLSSTPRAWVEAIQTALGPGAGHATRREAAQRALQIATQLNWTDHRRGFSHYANGRILQAVDNGAAETQFMNAQRYFATRPEYSLYRAYVASQLAAYAVADGRAADAIGLISPHLDTANRHENAALLATLMLLRAEALEIAGKSLEGRQVRVDSVGWARYGFGSDWAVRAKMREIASLSPASYGN